jgi:hypothetical protein
MNAHLLYSLAQANSGDLRRMARDSRASAIEAPPRRARPVRALPRLVIGASRRLALPRA